MIGENKKEIYHLWWEYLKRSADYKELCSWLKERFEADSLEKPLPPLPEKFRKDERGFAPRIIMTYRSFRDVHSNSFNDWWEYITSAKGLRVYDPEVRVRAWNDTCFVEYLSSVVNETIQQFACTEGREPTLEEFKLFYPQMASYELHRLALYGLHLSVDMTFLGSNEDIINTLRDIIIKERKNPEIRHYLKVHSQPGKHVRMDELKRFLKIYDLRVEERLKWKDVVKTISPDADPQNDITLRYFYRDLKKARRIIKNAEKGTFPGDY